MVVGALAAGVLTACGGSDGSDGGASADPSKDKLAQILARGTLVEYFEPDYPPQSMSVEGATRPAGTKCDDNQLTAAEVTGYDNEVPKLVAKELGVEACFVSADLDRGDRPGTGVTAGTSPTAPARSTTDRMERLYMTQPYYAVPNRYFVAKDSAFEKPSDLNGKKIGACAGCSHELYLEASSRSRPSTSSSTSRTRRS